MRLYSILLFVLLALFPAEAQSPPATNAPPRALPLNASTTNAAPRAMPVDPADLANSAAPLTVPNGINVHWFGHGFIYLTSSVGIRAAIDPFNPQSVKYKFPDHIAADFVLVTHEAEDHCAASEILGNPLIFRSVMAVGLNRANGIPFYGIALQKAPTIHAGANTAYTLTLDGVKFCYLGQVSGPLLSREKQLLGRVDVLFLPVGLQTLSVTELNQIAKDLNARMIIPINYKTESSGDIPLRSLDDYLSATKIPIRKISSNELVVTRTSLPENPTLYLLKSP